ncbi:HsmA family protein [Microcella sp.]|uniref:HsmA family protein n=1 Tax=Microcella sp. TaxID=1913979 RepID=UPI0025690B89|nr:HsmA family protein [Microcella sp.]MBX9470595.1 TIGR03987 family protein [Microcella sp.]
MLLPAIILITLALVFYTIGVWAERAQKVLKPWHTVFFGLGLAADASGTYLMSLIADANRAAGVEPSILNQVMAVSGLVALILMAVHFAWAVVVLVRGREAELHRFHRFSVIVWAIWLVPYITGALGSSLG